MPKSTHTILITGASRGIGLEFVKQYAELGCQVYACARAPEQAQDLIALKSLYSNIKLCKLDVESINDLNALAIELDSTAIDILINCAGIFGDRQQTLDNLSDDNIKNVFNVNALAPLRICAKLSKHVSESELKTMVTITSTMGSITNNDSGGRYAYRASKAAVNMMMKSVAVDLQHQDIKMMLLHPGWVKTDMGGNNANISPNESVHGMIKVIDEKVGTEIAPFYAFDGRKIPW